MHPQAADAADDEITADNFEAAGCPVCNGESFAFIPDHGYLICHGCHTGFRPHEYAAMRKFAETMN